MKKIMNMVMENRPLGEETAKEIELYAVSKNIEFINKYFGGFSHLLNWLAQLQIDTEFYDQCVTYYKEGIETMTPSVVYDIKDGKDAYVRFMVAIAGRFLSPDVKQQRLEERTMAIALNAGVTLDGDEWYDKYFTSKEVFNTFVMLPKNSFKVFETVMERWLNETDLKITLELINPFSKQNRRNKKKKMKEELLEEKEPILTDKEKEELLEEIETPSETPKKKKKNKSNKSQAVPKLKLRDYALVVSGVLAVAAAGYLLGRVVSGSDQDVVVIDDTNAFSEFR